MERTIPAIIIDKLMSTFIKSTISIVAKLIKLAIQKKIPLTTTEDIPDFYISIKESDTKELNPALSTTISPIIRYRLERISTYLEACRRIAAINPKRFIVFIILRLENPNLFFMYVPILLNIAVERLAANPSKAISFLVRPCPSNITPNKAP